REKQREKMTRGKQKIEAQRKNAEKNSKSKGSQLEHRAVALKVQLANHINSMGWDLQVQLANQNQLGDHYGSKHPKEKPPSNSE
ncbi:hypothetical protein M8C21_019332, partial [Ambrosia artemisiifolia]